MTGRGWSETSRAIGVRTHANPSATLYESGVLGLSQTRICAGCREPLPPVKYGGRGTARKWCSQACAARTRSRGGAWSRSLAAPRTCARCDASFKPGIENQRYCSPRCGWLHRSALQRWIPLELECKDCAEPFTQRNARQLYCSARCQNRADRRRRWGAWQTRRTFPKVPRRLRLRICERDGWRCGICRAAIDPALVYPHPGSASVDHINPRGDHALDNLQAAHLACNVAKGARAA